MKNWLSVSASLLLIAVLAGCAGTSTTTRSTAALSQYRTFGFVPESGNTSRAMALAKSDVSRQLMARGLAPSKNPDLLVNVHVYTKQQVRPKQDFKLGFAAARYQFLEDYYKNLPPGYHADINQSTEGHLTVDILDTQQHSVVWRGQASEPITRSTMSNPARAVNSAVSDAFRHFPIKAR